MAELRLKWIDWLFVIWSAASLIAQTYVGDFGPLFGSALAFAMQAIILVGIVIWLLLRMILGFRNRRVPWESVALFAGAFIGTKILWRSVLWHFPDVFKIVWSALALCQPLLFCLALYVGWRASRSLFVGLTKSTQ